MKVIYDEWRGAQCAQRELQDPRPRDVIRLIKRLNQRRYTGVILKLESGEYVGVGGGAGKFIVNAFIGGTFFYVGSPRQTGARTVVGIGSRDAAFDDGAIADERTAIKAALTFLATRRMASGLNWQRT